MSTMELIALADRWKGILWEGTNANGFDLQECRNHPHLGEKLLLRRSLTSSIIERETFALWLAVEHHRAQVICYGDTAVGGSHTVGASRYWRSHAAHHLDAVFVGQR